MLKPLKFLVPVLSVFTLLSLESGWAQTTVTPAQLKRYPVKELPSKLDAKVQAMIDVRSPRAGFPSSDGKRIFFEWDVTGTPQVWSIERDFSFPVQLTGGNQVTGLADITPDGKYLILERDRNGEENPGIYLQPTNGGELRLVQHLPKIQTNPNYVSTDSKYLYFSSNDIRPDSYALYQYNLESGEKKNILKEEGRWAVVDQRGDDLLIVKVIGNFIQEFSTLNLKSGVLTPILGQGEEEDYSVAFHPKSGLLVLTPKFGEFKTLYHLENGKFNQLTNEKADVESFSIDRAGKRILYQVNDQGFLRLKAMNAGNFKSISLPSLPRDAVHVFKANTSANGRFTTIAVITSKRPRTNLLLDWEKSNVVPTVKASTPEIDSSHFAEAKLESYPARDGTKIPMFVRRPDGCSEKVCPVVVHFHGGPEGQSIPGFSTFAQLFIDAGFIFVEPNVRGSEGYGKTWLAADNGPKRLNVVTDIEDFAIFAKKEWSKNGVTPKLGVMGWSYGGYSTLMAMTRFAGSYDVGVSLVGISNFSTFLKNTAPYRRKIRIAEYGDPEKDKEALRKLSPLTYLDKMNAPLLIIQGAMDPRVPADESIQIMQAMEKKKLTGGLMIFPDEGHGSQKRENRVKEWGNTLLFLEKHLK